MQIYLAPMEGITNYIYRSALDRWFPGVNRYFTPFISAQKNLNKKQDRDVNPQNNPNMKVIPQLMAHRAEDVLEMQALLKERYGYNEINLNQGCPSQTVVSKNHGSGFLRDVENMERYFDELFQKADFPISVKTRLGVEDVSEWDAILAVYQKFPFSEIIIHPRTTRDQYAGKPRMEAFSEGLERLSGKSICYNGDIVTLADYVAIKEAYPNLEKVMIGRGLLKNPMLLKAIENYEKTGLCDESISHEDWANLYGMMKQIRDVMQETFSGDAHVLAHLKELWGYLAGLFPENKKEIKSLKKSRKLAEYDAVVQLLFQGK